MNKLIILSAFFLASCANNQFKRRNIYQVKYTVREYYLPVTKKAELKPINSVKKLSKKSIKKKASGLDCSRVFREINQCMVR